MIMKTEFALGWIAALFSIIYYLSAFPSFFSVCSGKIKYQDFPIFRCSINLITCVCWLIYGRLIGSHQLVLCGKAGIGISCFIILIYLIIETKHYPMDAFLNLLLVILGPYAIYQSLTLLFFSQRIVGSVCILANTILYLSPLFISFDVCCTKNYRKFPICSTIILLLSCICWTAYSGIIKEYYVLIPKSAGIVLCLLEIIFYHVNKNAFYRLPEYEKRKILGIVSRDKNTVNEDNLEKRELTDERMDFDTNPDKSKVNVKVLH